MKKEGAGKTPVVKLSSVSKTYFGEGVQTHVLKNVSARVDAGEFVGITGPSGSGKSTMLNLIGCLDTPTAGSVEINGVDTARLSDDELTRLRAKSIGFVFQSFNLMPNLTALENVMLPLRIVDRTEEEAGETAGQLLGAMGLHDRGTHYPNQLSGGQQQRVAIARALATQPSLLLADEPTGNLDSQSGKSVMELLKKINVKGVTIVVVTHEKTVLEYAHRVLKMRDGEFA